MSQPKEYMPGYEEIRNLSDIEEFIENIVSGNDLCIRKQRESVNDKINYYKKTKIAVRE